MKNGQIWEKVLVFIYIVVVVAIGIYVRFDDLTVWSKNKNRFYYKDRPLFTSYDAFIFARYAEDFLEGAYKGGANDTLRFVPDGMPYDSPVPLQSFIAAVIKKILGEKYVEDVAIWMSPFFSILFVIPFIIFMYKSGYPLAGLAGAVTGVLSFVYVVRTSILRFDTDSLNLFFPFAISLLFLIYMLEDRKFWRFVWLFLCGVLVHLYWWWYRHSDLIFLLFITVLLALVLEFRRFSIFKERWKELLFLFLMFNPVFILSGAGSLISRAQVYILNYFKPSVEAGFPNILMSISEAKHVDIKRLAYITCGNVYIFALGFWGYLIFLIRKLSRFMLISLCFFIGIIAFKGANRFAMYLSPFVGAGVGMVVHLALDLMGNFLTYRKKIIVQTVFAVMIVLGLSYSLKPVFKYFVEPKITPRLAGDFIKLSELTPDDAWVWTWWDYGYAIQYLAKRAVYHDGGSQTSAKTYFIATSFSTYSYETARNVISALSNIGLKGINELVSRGIKPERIKKDIFDGKYNSDFKHPVYWVFTEDLVPKFAWISFFGNWDFNKKNSYRFSILRLRGCVPRSKKVFRCGSIIVDLENNRVHLARVKSFPIAKLVVRNKDGTVFASDIASKGVCVEFIQDKNGFFVFLMDRMAFPTMFNKLYILRKYDPRFFELVYDNFPVMVVYRVK